MSVSVSGPVLSALLYEQTNCTGDQEGFLLGQTVSHVTDTISDSQLNNRKEELVIYVYNYVACSRPFLWYDHAGRVNQDKLQAVLRGHKQQEVIGWYKWRRQSTLTPSMREKAIHKSLLDVLPGVDGRHFLFSLFSLSESSNQAKHTFEHIFHVHDGRTFQGLPLTIVNLKDTSQADYKRQASRTIHPREGFYAKTLQAFRPEFVDVETCRLHQVQGIHSLNSQLHQQLMSLYETVSASEESVGKLTSEVETLRERWKRKRYPPISNIDPGRLHAVRSEPIKIDTVTRTTASTGHPSPSPSQPKAHTHPSPTPSPPHPPQPSPPHPPLQTQRSNREAISEELRDLFLVPPVIVPHNQSGLVAPAGGDSVNHRMETLRHEDEDEATSSSPNVSMTTSDDDFITETLEDSPSAKRKTRANKQTTVNTALNNAESTAEVTTPKKKDAFSFVDNMLQDVKISAGIKNIPGKKQQNKLRNDLGSPGQGQATRSKVKNSPSSVTVKKVNNADVTSGRDETLDEDEAPASPVF